MSPNPSTIGLIVTVSRENELNSPCTNPLIMEELTMATDENKAIVRRYFEEVLDK